MAFKVKTRFAPSPTGFLHAGGVRTALFAWLTARQVNGEFLLRIEDTDRERQVEGAEKHILDSLDWLGLNWDGDIYRQSEHLDTYKKWAQKLIDSGRAYIDTRNEDQIKTLKQEAAASKEIFLYRNYRPKENNSWDGQHPLRLKSDPKIYKWHDEVMGDLSTGPEVIDDIIIMKSDNFPTYNFAHIVDDHIMGITHVMRSQEFASSIPKFLNIYEALGIDRPKLATLPYVLAPDGKKKLSKRDGANDVLYYQREGYLPQALISFLATLGWNDGSTQEIFTIQELLQKFSLSRVQRSGAKLDEDRLNWVNSQFIRELPIEGLSELVEDFWGPESKDFDKQYKSRVLEISKDRLKKLSELPKFTNFLFKRLKTTEEIAQEIKDIFEENKVLRLSPGKWLEEVAGLIKSKEIIKANSLEQPLKTMVEKTQIKPAVLYGSLRVALTGADQTPPVWEIIYAVGKEEALRRLENSVKALAS